MIVWQGKGWLVAVIIFGCSLIANLITNEVTGSEAYWDSSKQPFALSLIVAGILCWFLGLYFERQGARTLIDEETGEKVVWNPKHTLFWIPMKYCGLLAIAGSLVVIVAELA